MRWMFSLAVVPLVWSVGGVVLDGKNRTDCNIVPEIVLVQDVTYSYEDAMKNMAKNMPDVFRMLHDNFPGTKFGIVSFGDDPGCGYLSDHCANVEQSLLSPNAQSMKETQRVFNELFPSGGLDPAENFIGAIVRSLLSAQVGWSPAERTHDSRGRRIVRIMVATTDCVPHIPKQKARCYQKRSKPNAAEPVTFVRPAYAPFPQDGRGEWLAEDINARCGLDAFEYPDPAYMFRLFEEKDVLPIFLFGRGTAIGTRHLPNETFRYADYFNFASKFHYTPAKHPEFHDPHWEHGLRDMMRLWFKQHFKQTPIVEAIDDKMAQFPELLQSTLNAALKEKCGSPPISTTSTSTSVPLTSERQSTLPTKSTTVARSLSTTSSTTLVTSTAITQTRASGSMTTAVATDTDCTETGEEVSTSSSSAPETNGECGCKARRDYQRKVLHLVKEIAGELPKYLRGAQKV